MLHVPRCDSAALADVLSPLVESSMVGRSPGHDLLHVKRVVALSAQLAASEPAADARVAVTGAWLHELINLPKDHPQSAESGVLCAEEARRVLVALQVHPAFATQEPGFADKVAQCIHEHAYSKGTKPSTLESCILQDADRLDAMGALGIARCFATASDMKRPFYCEDDPGCVQRAPNDKAFTLDHFFRKLLKLKEGLHTELARTLAERRHAFLVTYVHEFARELAEDHQP